jgi:N-acetylglutamate synthase-like GNAT family acetyltransferase
MSTMYENSNIVITAWEDEKLVGVLRALSDFGWYTFRSDIAVNPDSKARGIGRKLIELLKEKADKKQQ